MKIQIAKNRKLAIAFLGTALLMLVILGFFILESNQMFRPAPVLRQYSIESLNLIIPGQTNLRDALAILGSPDSTEDTSYHPTRLFDNVFERARGYSVYIFANRQGWDYTELWVQRRGFNQIVVAILRNLPENVRDPSNNPSLNDFVIAYGRPDEVLWSSYCFFRYLIWSNEGVAVNAGSHLLITEGGAQQFLSWNEIPVATVFLFEPMDLKEIIDITKWPWPNNGAAWNPSDVEQSPVNICKSDHDPKDPFDWNSLPTPTP